jgi:Subtilase family
MATRRELATSITSNEVVFPDTSLVIEARGALDAQSAQGGIVVRGVRGAVRLSRAGRVARWTPEGALAPGHHLLLVGGLLTAKRRAIADQTVIPFFVTDSMAQVPKSVRVYSMSRLRVGDMETERLRSDRRPDGKFIELMKGSDRKTGAPIALAFDQSGRQVDADRIFRRLLAARVRKFGKLHETLHACLKKSGPRARVPVALWLRSEEALAIGEKKARGETKRLSRQSLARGKAIARTSTAFAARIADQYRAREFEPDPLAPVVYAELSRAEIEAIAKDKEVVGIFLHEREGIEDLSDSIAIANSDDVHSLGFKGSGVKVAVWEDSPDVHTNLSITARFKVTGLTTSDHARSTHGIVKNIEPNRPHGHAPSCALHSANTKELTALRWAVLDKGCTVISQSFHRSSEPELATMSYDDIYKDWLVLRGPVYPTICQAAGNFWNGDPDDIDPPSSEYVNHKGYNELTVGNHDDTASAMAGSSVFRNPSSPHGDRELPEIAANGTQVTTVGTTMTGTSQAAPAVAGCAALIQSVNPTLKSWPEGCRAILLAGAKRNVANNTWWQDVLAGADAVDGTGAVDALEATNIAKQRRSPNAPGTVRGWDVGTLQSSNIGSNKQTTFSYFVTLGRAFLSPRKVKVALAWDSKITVRISGLDVRLQSTLAVDLDLHIFDSRGVQVGYSGSWDNSYEIAEFIGDPGETYTIKIRRVSGEDAVFYGIAWTVTGGLFWADVTRGTVLLEAVRQPGP